MIGYQYPGVYFQSLGLLTKSQRFYNNMLILGTTENINPINNSGCHKI